MQMKNENIKEGIILAVALFALAGCGTPGTGTPTKTAVGAGTGAATGAAIGAAAGGPTAAVLGATAGGVAGGAAGREWGEADERRREINSKY